MWAGRLMDATCCQSGQPRRRVYAQTQHPKTKIRARHKRCGYFFKMAVGFEQSHPPAFELPDMSRTQLYARVSTSNQFTENQLQEVRAEGFDVQAGRVVEETISGIIASSERPGFQKLTDRMESGDMLIVAKPDRLGRNAMDVGQTVARLVEGGIRVHCLALGGVDLTVQQAR